MEGSESKPDPPKPPPPSEWCTSWRDITWGDNTEQACSVKAYHPSNKNANHLRVLLHGPIGAGKSSFINSVTSTLQGKISVGAMTDGMIGGICTKKYKTHKFRTQSQGTFYPFVVNDIMGLGEGANSEISVGDLKLAMRGRVKDGYEFRNGSEMSEDDPFYNKDPTIDDKVHILVCVIPIDTLSLMKDKVVQKMREVRLAARDLGIPQVAILTKIDNGGSKDSQDLRKTYERQYLKGKAEQFSQLLGLQLNCIFLVKNYSSETKVNADVDTLILDVLSSILTYGDDFLNDLNLLKPTCC
ncbi:interferon-induced protein 44-like [Genypterus blacodes]|uniref:interferon-induced protein 44-like n=1 Tax=Genypterus blacodes TaxID=154954 RepID=UPI003F772794